VAEIESDALQQAFAKVTECLAQFVRRSIDLIPEYRRESCSGANAAEADLQNEIYDFVKYTYPIGSAGYEPQKVAGGRADISLSLFSETLYIECKKELADATRQALQNSYAAQAGSYSAADHPLGVVAILDLTTPQTTSPPVFAEELWVHRQSASEGAKTLLFVRVAGRRVTPSELSK
jgi:hypothetical protein